MLPLLVFIFEQNLLIFNSFHSFVFSQYISMYFSHFLLHKVFLTCPCFCSMALYAASLTLSLSSLSLSLSLSSTNQHRAALNSAQMTRCVVSVYGLRWGRAHYSVVSQIQWKPFWLATQLYQQHDWTGWQNGVSYDMCTQALLCIELVGSRDQSNFQVTANSWLEEGEKLNRQDWTESGDSAARKLPRAHLHHCLLGCFVPTPHSHTMAQMHVYHRLACVLSFQKAFSTSGLHIIPNPSLTSINIVKLFKNHHWGGQLQKTFLPKVSACL